MTREDVCKMKQWIEKACDWLRGQKEMIFQEDFIERFKIAMQPDYDENGCTNDSKLADSTNVWHDAFEAPRHYFSQILYQDKSGFWWVTSQQEMYAYDWEWQRYVADFQMVRWAYANDLLIVSETKK